jgi:putative endonuclease
MNAAVYIVTNDARTLYIGVTSDLERRMQQHKQGTYEGFTKRYGLDRLVYFEQTNDIRVAIEREKQVKGWRRARKVELIELTNFGWEDLSAPWFASRRDGGVPRDPSLRSG